MKDKSASHYHCYLSLSQRLTLAQTFGCARFVYNLGLRTDAYRERGERLFSSDTSTTSTTLKQQPKTSRLMPGG
jgi:transposase